MIEQPEMSAEDETQETAVVEEIIDHPEIEPAPITAEAVAEDADKVAEHKDKSTMKKRQKKAPPKPELRKR